MGAYKLNSFPSASQMTSKRQANAQKTLSSRFNFDILNSRFIKCAVVIGAGTLYVLSSQYLDVRITVQRKAVQTASRTLDTRCKPYLPSPLTLLQDASRADPGFEERGQVLDRALRERVALNDIDNLVLGIVGPTGLLWSKGYGYRRANESDSLDPPDEHSIYRIASVSKLYATLETFIQRDRGALNWDDSVTRFYPNFTYKPYGWRDHLAHENKATIDEKRLEPITLRQLASHMSGIGRDYPSENLDDWPHVPPPPFEHTSPDLSFTPEGTYPQKPEILRAIAESPLVAPQYSYPIYSNTGFSLLGWCNSLADSAQTGKDITYAELVKRDIFEPLGMNGSSFLLSKEHAKHMAFPEIATEADYDMTDAFNSAGGQFSSVSDLAKTLQTFLNPNHPNALLSRYSLREWLRPLHVFPDHLTQVGLAWEIQTHPDSYGRAQSYYSKLGNLRYYHSQVVINPELGFGVVVLMAGRFADSSWFSKRAIEQFQPIFERVLEKTTRQVYAGQWGSEGVKGVNRVTLSVTKGSLWVTECVLNGDDLLEVYTGGSELSLWSTGRLHEFRVAIGRGELNSDPSMGCFPYWLSFDVFNSHGAPVDLLYFSEQGNELLLHFPSANVTLQRRTQ